MKASSWSTDKLFLNASWHGLLVKSYVRHTNVATSAAMQVSTLFYVSVAESLAAKVFLSSGAWRWTLHQQALFSDRILFCRAEWSCRNLFIGICWSRSLGANFEKHFTSLTQDIYNRTWPTLMADRMAHQIEKLKHCEMGIVAFDDEFRKTHREAILTYRRSWTSIDSWRHRFFNLLQDHSRPPNLHEFLRIFDHD